MSISLVKTNVFSYCKEHKKTIIIFGILLVFLLLTIVPTFAVAKDAMQNTCKRMVADIFSGGLSDSVKEIVLTNPATKYPEAWDIMTDVYKGAILPVAFGLLAIHLIIGVIQQSIRLDQLTWQQFIKPFLSFLAAWIIIKNGLNILVILISISQEITETMSISAESSMETLLAGAYAIVEKEVDGIISGVFFMFQLFLPWAAALILNIAIKVVCYSRIFELYLKTMIAPLGMSDVVTKGLEGNGLRFFKNYFATCLQGAVIVGISIIYGAILGSVLPVITVVDGVVQMTQNGVVTTDVNIAGLAGTALVMGFAALSMMMKAGQIAKEVLGA